MALTAGSCGDATPAGNDASSVGSEGWPSWSPDGALLVFVRTRPVDDGERFPGEIFAMHPDGSGLRPLTDDAGLHKSAPAWSPDGSRIAFDARRWPSDEWNLYTMNADGSDVRQVTVHAAQQGAVHASSIGAPIDDAESATIPIVSGNVEPMWSPDGSRIVFYSFLGPGFGPRDIFTINVDGSDLRRLTSDLDAVAPAWSPDGSRIAFYMSGDIFTMAPDGGDIRRLTDRDDLHDAGPAWSPDGVRIAFGRSNDATSDIVVMCADGTGLSRLATMSTDRQPAWSPDGSRIAVSRSRDAAGVSRIHVIDVARTALTRSEDCSP